MAKDERGNALPSMSFGEHLEELRSRLIKSLLAVALGMGVFFFMKDTVTEVIKAPYDLMYYQRLDNWYEGYKELDPAKLTKTARELHDSVTESFPVYREKGTVDGLDFTQDLKRAGFSMPRTLLSITPLQDFVTFMLAAALFGLAVASPIVLRELWMFIGAGLYKKERSVVMSFLPASIGLFVAGAVFGYFVMVPAALRFLTQMSNPLMVQFHLTVRDYFGFLFILTLALGAVFQLPVIMVALVRVGIVKPSLYTKYWRHAILVMFILGAFLTPPDPVTQVLMAGPMTILFFVGIVLSRITYRKRQAAADDESSGADGA